MLEHPSLLIQCWTRSTQADGALAWVRSITDAQARPLGFVRCQKLPALSWLFWLTKARLDVFETEDASHLMSLTRSWTMFNIWDLHDAEDQHVGRIYPQTLIASEGSQLGLIDGGAGRILDPTGQIPLARFTPKDGADLEVAFAPESCVNPFVRMMILGYLLTLDPKPR